MSEKNFMDKAIDKLKEEYVAIEDRTDITDDQKIGRIIKITSAICAGVAIQPIPFADIFILTPIQIVMGTRIAAVRGLPVTKNEVVSTLKEISGAVGLGYLAQQLAIGAYKTGLPFLGGFMTIPLVYGLTYGIGRVMDAYFIHKTKGQLLKPEQIAEIWKKGEKEGKKSTDKASAEAYAKDIRGEGND